MAEDGREGAAPSSQGGRQRSESGEGSKPVCQYGRSCYRKNPQHFAECDHPWLDKEMSPVSKRRKLDDPTSSSGSRHSPITLSPDTHSPVTLSPEAPDAHSPFTLSPHSLYYLTCVRGVNPQYNASYMALGIEDILSPLMGDLICSAQFNYLIDIPWLLQQYPSNKRKSPILIVHGEQRDSLLRLRKEAEPYPNVTLFQAKLEIMFGTHHSKMMLLACSEGLRVVIHTANLVQKDWDQKTQGVWVSPLFPSKKMSESATQSEVEKTRDTGFQRDLLEYLSAYGGRDWMIGRDESVNTTSHLLDHHTFHMLLIMPPPLVLTTWGCLPHSYYMVRLIASVPGAHTGGEQNKWGHLKLRRVLSSHCIIPDGALANQWPVIGQFSSIGSLGPSPAQWLTSEWLTSLSSSRKRPSTSHKTPPVKLIFPSVSNVRDSLEGYMAGGSIPYASRTAAKQPYLRDYLHQWKADGAGRSRAAPHIKTYMRVSPDQRRLAWILITSANLSKAAWGAFEKKGSQLKIRSYEIGVLFLPSDQKEAEAGETFSTTTCTKLHSNEAGETSRPEPSSGMRLTPPFDLPLTPYTSSDQPWVWNARHMEPDSKGNVWTPS